MAQDTAPRTGGGPRFVAAAVAATRAWGQVLSASAGLAAGAAAVQFGVAYGLQVVRFRREFPPGGTWATQLTWVAWISALAVVAGAVGGVWTAHRLAGGYRRLELGHRIAVSLSAGLGGALAVVLAALPARQADLTGADPALEAALAALLGLVVGVLAAVSVLSVRVVAVSVTTLVAVAWLVALVSVVPTLGPSADPALVRLGVLDLGVFGEGARRGVAVLSPPLIALIVGIAVAGAARSLGLPVVRTILAGAAGPVLLALTYLVAPPGGGSDAVQAAAFAGAMIAIAAGLLGAVAMVAFRRPRSDVADGWPPDPYAAAAGDPHAGGPEHPYTFTPPQPPGGPERPYTFTSTPPQPSGGPDLPYTHTHTPTPPLPPAAGGDAAPPPPEYGRAGTYGAPAYPSGGPDDTGQTALSGPITPPPWQRSDDGDRSAGGTGPTGTGVRSAPVPPPPPAAPPTPAPPPVTVSGSAVPAAGGPPVAPGRPEMPAAGRPAETPERPAVGQPERSPDKSDKADKPDKQEKSTDEPAQQSQAPEGAPAMTAAGPPDDAEPARKRRGWRRREDRREGGRRRRGDGSGEDPAQRREDQRREDQGRQRRGDEAPPQHEAAHVDWVRSLAGAEDDAPELRTGGRRRLRRDAQLFADDADFDPELRLPGPDRRPSDDR